MELMTLDIKDKVYTFKFGIKFLKDIDSTEIIKENGVDRPAGFYLSVAGLIDRDPISLVKVLLLANKTENPKITESALCEYIESVDDLESLFEETLGFLRKSNVTGIKVKRFFNLPGIQEITNE